MHMYTRTIEQQIKEKMFKNKVIILYGARQVGKTTLVKKYAKILSMKLFI